MRCFHRLAVVVLAAAGLGTHQLAAAAATDPVTNPGFEQRLSGWHTTGGLAKVAAPRTGAYSAQVYGATEGQNMSIQPIAYPVMSTGANETSTAGAWVYSPRRDAHLCLLVNDRDVDGTLVHQTSSCLYVAARTWQHLHIAYTIRAAGHSLTLAVQQRAPHAGEWFDVDDVSLSSVSLPTNTVAPSITGAPRVKTRLVGNPGTWVNGPVTLVYEWDRCRFGYGCIAILQRGPSPTYVVQPADAGYTIAFSVIATNAYGVSAASAPFTVPAYY